MKTIPSYSFNKTYTLRYKKKSIRKEKRKIIIFKVTVINVRNKESKCFESYRPVASCSNCASFRFVVARRGPVNSSTIFKQGLADACNTRPPGESCPVSPLKECFLPSLLICLQYHFSRGVKGISIKRSLTFQRGN